MANEPKRNEDTGESAAAVQTPPASGTRTKEARKAAPSKTPPKHLPRYKVLLHNDDVNDMDRVVAVIVQLTPLDARQARERTLEAHNSGVALLLVTHKERAELYQQQFISAKITATIEPE